MKRRLLAAAAATAPLLMASVPALAQVTISSSTSTPVTTATANAGQPADVDVTGSINLSAAGTALTLNSNNTVTVSGSLSSSNQNSTTGLNIVGGYTGSATLSGSIQLTETYTPPTDPNNDGLYTGAFAQGSDRVGVEVTLPSSGSPTFVGSIINTGTITVNGNDSEGVSIQAPISGDFTSLVVTPATTSAAATIAQGTITVTGQNAIGLQITPTGGVGGNMRITCVSATGPGAQAVQLNGNVGGYVNISSGVVATGYRTTTRQTNPYISVLYSQEEMQQGGAAVTVGGNVGAGLIVSAPPPILSTTNLDLDNDGVPDTLQGTGSVVSYGSAPAMQIGAVSATGTAPAITIGAFTGSSYLSPYNTAAPTQQFGLVIQGSVLGESLFDPLTSPYLLGQQLSATALQIGGPILITPVTYTFGSNNQPTGSTPAVYLPSGSVNVVGGLYNSGTIAAYAYQGNATAIRIGAGATVPTIYNDGAIFASSIQVNSALTSTSNGGGYPNTPAPTAVNVTGIEIDAGASVTTITNNSGILAELTGTAGAGGATGAIIDKSGTLQNINNTGSIEAVLNQTVVSALMPTTSASGASNAVAIDMSAGTLPQTINQSFSPLATSSSVTAYAATSGYTVGQLVSYQGNIYVNTIAAGAGLDPVDDPSYWREIGATTPAIVGDIYMGSGPDTLNIQAGDVTAGKITMGAALNTINIQGSTVTTNGVTSINSPVVGGYISEKPGGQFQISVNEGALVDTNPTLNQSATSISVGATGVLNVAADPINNQNTQFTTTGAVTIAPGGQIGLNLVSLQTNLVQTYTVIQGAAGTISAPSLAATSVGNTPFLYSALATYVASEPGNPSDSAIDLTVTRKTAAQLGFNAEETAAYNAILNTLSTNTTAAGSAGISQGLLSQTSETGLKSVYDQLLPNQGQGIFEALDAAVEKESAMTATPPDNATHVGGASLWLQEVNERVDRSGVDSLGSDAKVLGLVGGYERMGAGGGAMGVTLAYFNAQETDTAAQLGARDVASMVEAGVYYRRSLGNLTFSARGGAGYGWFSENRIFAYLTTVDEAQASWSGAFYDGHVGASYEIKLFGPYYARPELSLDYLTLHQNGYQETGPETAFNLALAPQTDTQFSGQALMVLGRQWGRAAWFRSEVRFGYREVISGEVGDVTANFQDGTPFTVAGDPDKGGWATVGFSLKSGSEFSYLALEGDADFRKGEQRYDLRVAGRSVF